MESIENKFKSITTILLEDSADFGEVYNASNDLFLHLYELSEMDDDTPSTRENLFLPTGKAIGPYWAALCVKEFIRTRQFLRGIHAAIKASQKQFPGEPVQILYAGTGPFATLALPFINYFSPDDIRFTFLEINPESIQCLKRVIHALNAEPYIEEIVECDATQFHGNNGKKYHLILSETMLNALQKEPQVAIALNLAPQLAEGGIFIPQNIRIDAALMSYARFNQRILAETADEIECHQVIETIFQLNHQTALAYSEGFPKHEITIPTQVDPTFNTLCLFTHIEIFEGFSIEPWQCSLTLPQKIMSFKPGEPRPSKMTFQYVIQERCGFSYHTL